MIGKPYKKTFVKNPILGTKFTIAISSAKGGVGKSTFATNLALALKNLGCKVGVVKAINWFFKHVDEGIIMEDDNLAHPDFFVFCQKLLQKYRFDKRYTV